MRYFLATILVCLSISALAQQHNHNNTAGKFYESWNRPDNRNMSCCNNQDCAPVDHVRYWNGQLQMQRKSDGEWLTIPKEKLESNYNDARDSPDGFSHMCSNGEYVFCAVLGSGI